MLYDRLKLLLIAFIKALNTDKGWNYTITGSYPLFDVPMNSVNVVILNGDKINPYATNLGANEILYRWNFNIMVYAPVNLGGVNAIDAAYSRFEKTIIDKDFDYEFSCELTDETIEDETLKSMKISLLEVFGLDQSIKIENKLIYGNKFTLTCVA